LTLNNEAFRKLLLGEPDKALLYLFEHYYKRLLIASEWRTQDPDLSEDIVQDTLAFIWKNHRAVANTPGLLFEQYLFMIVKKKSITAFLTALNHKRLRQSFNGQPAADFNTPESEYINQEEDRKVWDLINTFPRAERECMILKFQKQMSNEEVAQHLKVSIKAVEGNANRAFKRMRKYRSLFADRFKQ